MEDIARFLYNHPFFSQVPFAEMQRLAQVIQVKHFPNGFDILVHNGKPAEFLYVIYEGSVDLLREGTHGIKIYDTLDEGGVFGHPSLIRGLPPSVTVRTREDATIYLIPAATFHQLRHDYPAFAQFFAASVIERLRTPLLGRQTETSPTLFQTRLRDLIQRSLVTVKREATVREAAQVMREQNIASLIVEGTPPGIITARDLSNRVLAAGLSDHTPIAQVMRAPALTLPAESMVFEGLMLMLENGIHHLPITDAGQVVGVVTHTDILRHQSRSPLFLPRQLQRAQTSDELRAYADQVTATVGALLDVGARVSDIGRVVAVAHDALLVRLLRDAMAHLGEPPAPYAWLVLGSEGRYEQTLRTDQDNALVYADDAPPEANAYFATLAERVINQLVACGFPRCLGDMMASNPEWRQPLRVWQTYFQRWINTPDEEALLRAAIFFDYRQVYGTLDAEAALRPIVASTRGNRVFLSRLARTALRQPAPLGFFRQIVLERKGGQRDLLDLKARGTAMIVDLARLFALEAGCLATNTLARLRLAAPQSSLSEVGAEELSTAFELISLFRLRHQYAQIQRGEQPTNLIAVSSLSDLERRELKEVLRLVGRIQHSVELTFQISQLG
jgi:CBS domain-containing protein